MTIPLLARDVAGLIRQLHLNRPIVTGWSMGGEIAITLAERDPGLMAGIVTSGGDA
jgi:pimeloyl-ACP methyl ester carboxylesterase